MSDVMYSEHITPTGDSIVCISTNDCLKAARKVSETVDTEKVLVMLARIYKSAIGDRREVAPLPIIVAGLIMAGDAVLSGVIQCMKGVLSEQMVREMPERLKWSEVYRRCVMPNKKLMLCLAHVINESLESAAREVFDRSGGEASEVEEVAKEILVDLIDLAESRGIKVDDYFKEQIRE